MNSEERCLLILLTLTLVVNLVLCDFKLLLLHTNDMHSRFQETNEYSATCVKSKKCYGGFARLKTAVEQSRKEAEEEGRSSIFLNAGDTYQGTVYYTQFKWRIVSRLLNMMSLDVMSLGNHEFDDGPEGLTPLIKNSSVPIVSCNLDYSKEPAFSNKESLRQLVPSYVLDVNGVKVGVIGYLTPDTKFLAQTKDVDILDEITEIRKEVKRLKDEGVKILIALGHSGFTRDKQIAEQVADLDIVVGGHTNTFLYNGKVPDLEKAEGAYPTVVTQPSGRKVYVVQAYAYTKYLGHLKVTFDDNGEVLHADGNPILLDESFRKNPEVERAVLEFDNEINKTSSERKIGFSKSFLEASDTSCRLRECNFGNLVADSFVDQNAKDYFGKGWTDAPIAFLQGGGLRASIDPSLSNGVITYMDLLTTLPFGNSVERLRMKGSVLRQVLEHSVSRYSKEEKIGGFLQYSGIQVVYDLSKPSNQRIVSAKVRCGDCPVPQYYPLVDDQEYTTLTITFLTNGGDGYSMLREVKDRTTLSFIERDAVDNYLSRVSPVNPELSGRIQLMGTPSAAGGLLVSGQLLLLCAGLLRIASSCLLGG